MGGYELGGTIHSLMVWEKLVRRTIFVTNSSYFLIEDEKRGRGLVWKQMSKIVELFIVDRITK